MSSESVQGIAGALGKLASGDVSATDSGFGRLLVMAASRSGGSDYADLLTKGIDGSQMNVLMESMVSYLQEIANSNKVVQQQYANVFGLKTSDIMAAKNLSSDITKLAKLGSDYNYNSGIGMLNNMASTMGSRIGLAGMMSNLKENFAYTLAAGIADNQTVVLRGEGEPGVRGGAKGDLYIVVRLRKHNIYTRKGTTVYCNVPITFTQATLGAELEIPMVDGSKEKYKIPEGTQNGTDFTIKGKGFKSVNGAYQGDYIFTVQVQIPRHLTKEQRDILLQLAKTMNEQPPVRKKGIFG